MRRLVWWALCAGGLVLLAGCDGAPTLVGAQEQGQDGEVEVEVLTVSPAWQAGADGAVAVDRIAALTTAIRDLRSATGSGWVGRQDDVTGYLGELRGGRYESPDAGGPSDTAAAFLDQWGPDLFGIDAQAMDFIAQGAPDPSGSVVLRGLQHVAEVPVVDGVLTVTVADAQTNPRISALRGRVFPGLDVATTPTLDETAAAQAAVGAGQAGGGGEAQGEPTLVVYPGADGGDGALAWEVTVVGGGSLGGQDDNAQFQVILVYVDAGDGTIIATRPASFDVGHTHGPPATRRTGTLAQAEEQVFEGESVEVSGEGPVGDQLTATGLQTDDGSVVLLDPTLDTYDPSTGLGGTVTHDGDGLEEVDLPGPAATFDSTEITDPDALAAHAFSRYIMDYLNQVYGRNSWDGNGGTLTSVVNHGPDDFCNAFFSDAFQPPLMVYGNPCIVDGQLELQTMVDVDVAAHEVTHGVTSTSAGLLYSGQSGALNESFSDYFGNVIGDQWRSTDSEALGEDLCEELPDSPQCVDSDDGTSGLRDLLNGNGLSDYLGLLDPSLLLKILGFRNDNGGVHLNSAIWNNALFSIRSRLAQIDGTSARESVRALNFDQAVYATLVQRLGPTSGFLEAAAALEESAIEIGLDPESIEIIRETLVLNDLCADCTGPQPAVGDALFVAAGGQKQPVLSGDRTAWLDFQANEVLAQLVVDDGTGPAVLPDAGPVLAADFAGDAIVAHEVAGAGEAIVRHDESGDVEVLATGSFLPAVGGSEEGAAWLDVSGEAGHVDADGAVTSTSLAGVGDGLVTALGAGGGTVAFGTDAGEVIVWQVGSDPVTVDTLGDAAVLSVAADGDRVLAAVRYGPLDGAATGREVIAYDLSSAERTVLADSDILFYGVALAGDYAVWPAIVGTLPGGINEQFGDAGYVDSDLHVYSFETGEVEVAVEQPGQQGYADLAGDRLVWQDAVNGGDDIYGMELP